MSLVFDIIGGLVNVGMEAYRVSQANEAQALRMLQEALVASGAKVRAALEELDKARAEADKAIEAGWQGGER